MPNSPRRERPANRLEARVIDLHEDFGHRGRHAVESPLARRVGLQIRADAQLLKVSGTLLEFDAGTDFTPSTGFAVGVDDDSPDGPARLQFGGELGRNRLIMVLGRPARPVRSKPGVVMFTSKLAGIRGSSTTSRPSASAFTNAPYRPRLRNLPWRICSAVGTGVVRIWTRASGTGFPSGPTTLNSNFISGLSELVSAEAFWFCWRGRRLGRTQMRQREGGDQDHAK